MKNLYVIALSLIVCNTYSANDHIRFIENKGQITNTENQACDDILFHTESAGMGIFLKKTSLSYVFQSYPEIDIENLDSAYEAKDLYIKAHRVDLHFVGANTNPEILKQEATDAVYNFYNENSSISGTRAYEKLEYKNIYKNTDVIFYTSQPGHMKYDIIVNPGGDPKNIGLYYIGADDIRVSSGILKVSTGLGIVAESMPKVYQNINGKIIDVKAEYILEDEIVKFKTGEYNKNYSLIIDPWVTFVGGSSYDFAYGIDVDNNGNITTIGSTNPVLFPLTPGAFQTNYGGGSWDMFVTKFDDAGNLVFSTLMGGAGDDLGYAATSDLQGNIYITGSTTSTGLGAATTIQATKNGNSDAIIVKFGPLGNRIWSTYYGGGNADEGCAINADASGNIFIGGDTKGGINISSGCFQPSFAGSTDAFLLKINTTGPTRVFCTYLGGSGNDIINDMDIDPATGDIAIIGNTASTNFPISAGAYKSTVQGVDNFIARFNSSGSRVWATYFGGIAGDQGNGVAFDNQSDIAFCGTSFSSNLPTTINSFRGNQMGPYNGFIGKLNSTGAFQWVTYYGTGMCEGYGVAINKANNDIYVSGDIYWSGLPTWACAFQPIEGGGQAVTFPFQPGEDQFIARFDANGSFKCNTYVGGFGHDDATGRNGGNICYFKGDVYISAQSSGAYPTTPNAFQTVFGGGSSDAVIARICGHTCGDNTVTVDITSDKDSVCAGNGVNFSDLSSVCDTSESKWYWIFQGGTPSSSTLKNPTNIIYNVQGSYSVKLLLETPCGKDSIVYNNFIYVSDPIAIINSATNVSCFGGNNGAASVGVFGGVTPYSYSWSPTAGINNSISNLIAGNYSVTITDKIGCTSSAYANITEPSILSVTAVTIANAGCSGMAGIISTSITGGTSPYSYSWNTSPAQLASNATGLAPGTYSVIVTDSYGCSATATATVIPSASAPIIISINNPSPICEGNSVLLSATVSGGGGIYSYTWLPSNTNGNTLIVTPSSSTTYSLVVTDNCNSPSAMAVTTVTVNPKPNVLFSVNDSIGCAPLCINFTNNTAGTNSCVWNLGDGTFSSQSSFSHCYNDPGSFSVSLTVTDNNGCTNTLSKANYIVVYPNPVAAFSSSPTNVTLADPTVYFTDNSNGATTWQWNFGGVINSSSTIQNPKFIYADSGSYNVRLIVSNEFGCTDSAYRIIYINPIFALYVPNSFSPNGDNLNDEFLISGIGIKHTHFSLMIFDRWGALLFITDDINKGWDGRVNNRIAQIDTYVWKISLTTFDGQLLRKSGHVNLIK